ncbi:hypothetical protein J2S13_002495 [Oikeobacillus pervagus]|uniref:Uncharacterized protein n=1 Tax=Oikeobacillus pervagus TaxID=1325931 RepID=A0AAJ1WK10_9BACI|nr:hypothetical protein [Oikeobacillus pervagus]
MTEKETIVDFYRRITRFHDDDFGAQMMLEALQF